MSNGLCMCTEQETCATCNFCLANDSTAGRKALCEKITRFLISYPFYQRAIAETVQKLFPDKRVYDDERDVCTMLFESVLFEDTSSGTTPMAYFVEHAALSATEKTLYEAWHKHTRYGFFAVERVWPGKSLEVLSLCNGDELLSIAENKGSRTIRQGSVIVARLVPFEKSWMITTETILSYPGARAARKKLTRTWGSSFSQFDFTRKFHEDRKRRRDQN